MGEKTMFEGGHPARQASHSSICFGRIVGVSPSERMCSVKTFFSTHQSLANQHIDNCQWLNMDSNPDGDESTSVPRKGSMAMVFYVDGEPFVFGFFKALNKGKAITGKEVSNLTEGDKIFSTKAGSYIKVGANRSIEIKSKETLSTLYFPTESLLRHLCRNYELKAEGGYIDWKSKNSSTLYSALFRNGTAASAFILEERGAASGGVYRTAVGPGPGGFGNIFVYEQVIDITGKVTTTVGPPGVPTYVSTVNPDGSFSVVNGAGNAFSASVSPLGDLDAKFGPLTSLSIKSDGSIEVITPGISLTASNTGDVKLTAAGKVELLATQDVEVTATGDLKLTAFGACTLSALGGIKLDGLGTGGGGAQFGVLSFPNVIDPFTGTPLGPGSTTVLISI